MRKVVYLCVIILQIVLLSQEIAAAEYTYGRSEAGGEILADGWERILEYLPEDVRTEAEEMDPVSGEGIREKILPGYWLERIYKEIREEIGEIAGEILPLCTMMVMMAAVDLSIQNEPFRAMHRNFSILSSLAASAVIFGMTDRLTLVTGLHMDRLCGIMNLLTPVMEGLFLASGNLTRKAVASEAVMLGVTVIGNFSGKVLVPLTDLLFALSCIGHVCTDVKIGGIVSGLRKWITRLWQFGTMIFSFMLGIQSILTKSADSLSVRTIRFVLGNFIPVAGGVLGEAFTTLKEGVGILRSTAGIGGILVILLLLIPAIVPLILYRAAVSLAEFAAEALNLNTMKGLLGEIHGIADMLFGFVVYTSLMFVLVLMIFAESRTGV